MDTATKYDTLATFESWFSHQKNTYAVHKQLMFNTNDTNDGIDDINDWLAKNFPLKDKDILLDAGCGTGKTIFTYAKKCHVIGIGISLSKKEVALAREAATQLDVTNSCIFEVRSYDEPFNQLFDQIIAIESLKHSKNLQLSLDNLDSSLKHGGRLIIVEDMRKGILPNNYFRNLLLNHWSLIDLYSKEDYILSINTLGISQIQEVDFTHLVKVRKTWWSFTLVYFFHLIKMLTPFPTARKILSIFQAGFALEYYYKKGMMKYKVLVFKKI